MYRVLTDEDRGPRDPTAVEIADEALRIQAEWDAATLESRLGLRVLFEPNRFSNRVFRVAGEARKMLSGLS